MEVTPIHLGGKESVDDDNNINDKDKHLLIDSESELLLSESSANQLPEQTEASIATAKEVNPEDSPTEELRMHEAVDEESEDDYDPTATEMLDGNDDSVTDEQPEQDAAGDEDEDDYDPEKTLSVSQGDEKDDEDDDDIEVKEKDHQQEDQVSADDDDDYDPTESIASASPPSGNSILKGKAPPIGLPPKPQLNVVSSTSALTNADFKDMANQQLHEAYDTIMNSGLVKDPEFVQLPAQEQMKRIMEKLEESNVELNPNIKNNPNINFNQVYSFNKPFKNLKSPIPLIPVNEYCRRPNITAPMTAEEEEAYQQFIKTETYYMRTQKWDEFPDKLRLFIGNLPANTISKQDLFRIFSQYGEVVQISIKAGFGFAQFRTAEQCLSCIKGESNVPLHNKIMRLDASKPQTPRNKDRRSGGGGRDRERDDGLDIDSNSKRRKIVPDCFLYSTGKSSVFYIRKVKKALTSAHLSIETEDVTHNDINEVVQEAAYSGVLGACIIKDMKVDLQTFQETSDGGVKFDEYTEIEPEVAADILVKAKELKSGSVSLYGGGSELPPIPPQSYPQQQQHSPLQHQPNPSYSSGPDAYPDPRGNKGYDLHGGAGNRRSGNRGGGDNYRGGDRGGRNRKRDRDRRQGYERQQHQQQAYSSLPWSSSQQPYYGNPPGYDNNPNMGPQGYGGGYNSNKSAPPYGQPQQYNQPYGSYGNNAYNNAPPYNNPNNNYNQYGGGGSREPDTNNLLSTLKNIDPQSMQSMINMLQQQLGPQQPQQPLQQQRMPPPQLYGGQYGQMQAQSNTQVNSLLSQLKSSDPNHNQETNALSLMETLARLSKK
ncbi:uncharacterized protein KQ657_004707 [Scheffersomyces spartinae]|uniref:RRM domain-containing protein n=1 Tax=Scheffersomyces spartinae TaxID=45513 RepID=A0A9P8AJV6_9ASCO|nr:uncharacterized protein KQ657_004707 [Scheffersomyces spartinae]KAG7194492.1 hypothetical protein KQ657_004707 [Scheffersomyces spartinae]